MCKTLLATLVATFCVSAQAGGPLGIDHMPSRGDTGIWSRSNQRFLEFSSAAVVVGGALWEGSESRLGNTFWRSADAMVIGDLAAQGAKLVFRRERPLTSNDPNAWFKTSHDKSFPSGEVTHLAAIVTPFVAEYSQDYPAVWAMELLPVWDGVARLKSQAHWQSDVLAGMALGTAIGLYSAQRSGSWLVGVVPGGLTVGYRQSF